MARETITVSAEIPVRPGRVFKAWLSAKEHQAFTGATAAVEARAGTRHTAWGGYIHGWTLAVHPGKRRFTQAWRTTEFAPGDVDSTVTVTVTRAKGGARLTIAHADLPEGQGEKYRKGWEEHYVEPLRKYFAAVEAAPKKKAAKKARGEDAPKKKAPKAEAPKKAAKGKAAGEKQPEGKSPKKKAKEKAPKKKAG